MSIDPIALASALINCPSVTPASGEVFDVLEAALEPLGFEVHRFIAGEPPDGPVENLIAIRGEGAPHFGFAGHLDVVPAGDGWSSDPFAATVAGAPPAPTPFGPIVGNLDNAKCVVGDTWGPILLIGSETLSKITDMDDRAIAIIVGDGAGAVVVEPV